MSSSLDDIILPPTGQPPTINVDVFFPETEFGGVQINGATDPPIQVEIDSGSAVQSVFGRVGNVVAQASDYAAYYAPLGQVGAVSSVFGRQGAIVAAAGDYAAFYEPGLGNPNLNGMMLTSTPAGVRSWTIVPPPPVSSVFGRLGAVVAQEADYSAYFPSMSVAYDDPSWIAFLSWSKITGVPAFEPALGNPSANGYILSSTTAGVRSWIPAPVSGVTSFNTRTGAVIPAIGDYAAQMVTNAVDSTVNYANPSWIFSLAWNKIIGAPAFITQANAEPPLGNPSTDGYILSSTAAGARSWIPAATGGITGSGAANQVAIFSAATALTSSANLAVDPTSGQLIVTSSSGTYGQYGLKLVSPSYTTVLQPLGAGAIYMTDGLGNPGGMVLYSLQSAYGAPKILLTSNTFEFSGGKLLMDGGFTVPSAAKGDLMAADVNGLFGRIGVGTDGQILTASSAASNGVAWITPTTGGGVSSVFGRTGAIAAATGDYTAAQVTNAVSITGSYPDPVWIPSLDWIKLINKPTIAYSVFGRSGAVVAAAGDYAGIYEPVLGNPSTNGYVLSSTAAGVRSWVPSGGSGTVTGFSAGNLVPLFTTSVANPASAPALSFALTNAAANSYFGNQNGLAASPTYITAGTLSGVNDTNVTLTLGGTPASSMLKSVSLTLGWTGTLSAARGGTGSTLGAEPPLGNPPAGGGILGSDVSGNRSWNTISGTGTQFPTTVSPTFSGNPAATFSGNINVTGTFLRPNTIQGTNTNDAAAAGNLGETLTNVRSTALTLVNNTDTVICTITLTPGDWDVRGSIMFASTVNSNGIATFLGSTSTTTGRDSIQFQAAGMMSQSTAGAQAMWASVTPMTRRYSVAANTNINLVGWGAIATGNPVSVYGYMEARRIR